MKTAAHDGLVALGAGEALRVVGGLEGLHGVLEINTTVATLVSLVCSTLVSLVCSTLVSLVCSTLVLLILDLLLLLLLFFIII